MNTAPSPPRTPASKLKGEDDRDYTGMDKPTTQEKTFQYHLEPNPAAHIQMPQTDWILQVLSITPMEGRGALQAYVNLKLGPFVINDFRIIKENGKRPWVSWPVIAFKSQYGTTQYKSVVFVEDTHLKEQVSRAILAAWEKNKEGNNNGRKE